MDSDEDSDVEWLEINDLQAVIERDSKSTSLVSSVDLNTFPDADSDEYYKIERALALNKLYDEKLLKLEDILKKRLHEIRERLSEIQGADSSNDKQENVEVFRYIRCGKPYFKDSSNIPAPRNHDTILMAQSNMFDFSDVHSVAGWTLRDKKAFVDVIHKMSRDIRERELNSKLAQLKRDQVAQLKAESQVDNYKVLKDEIKAIKAQINSLKKKTLSELALPIEEEYDWDAVTCALNQRHTATEYRALWKLYMHPLINKNSWTKKEHLTLQEIAQECNYEDWDNIATRLNTGRTGYQCFVYFRTNMSNTFTGQKWTPEEELYLMRLIDYYKEDGYIPWGKVAASIENRTKIQIYNKFLRLAEKRKGRFLPEEDAVILTFVENFGTNFKKMTEFLPGRSAAQLRVRYKVLGKRRLSTVWTVEEDKKLIQMMANNQMFLNYADLATHFPGKDRCNIRTRYLTLVKWMKLYPNRDLKQAPRRGARRLGHGRASNNLHKAIENLKLRMETEVEKKKGKKITIESSEEDIEDAIIASLINENAFENTERNEATYEEDDFSLGSVATPKSLSDINLKTTLILLKAKLNRQLFDCSRYGHEFSSLLKKDQEGKFVTIRSYSRKSSTKTFELDNNADIWGKPLEVPPLYVFPPHFATITGCRKLMDHLSKHYDKDDTPININMLARRNCLFDEQLFILMERFNLLFVWPMMLSNRGPPSVNEIPGKMDIEDMQEEPYV